MAGPSRITPHRPPTYQGLPSARLRQDWEDRLITESPAYRVGATNIGNADHPANLIHDTLFYMQNGAFRGENGGFDRAVVQEIETNLKKLGYLPQSFTANGGFDNSSLRALTRFTQDHAPNETVKGLNGREAITGGRDERRYVDSQNWAQTVVPVAQSIASTNPQGLNADVLYAQYLDMHYGWNNVTALNGINNDETARVIHGQIHGMHLNTDNFSALQRDLASNSASAIAAEREADNQRRNAEFNEARDNTRAQSNALRRGDYTEVMRLEDESLANRGIDVATERANRVSAVRDFEAARHAAGNDLQSNLFFIPGVNALVALRDPGINNAVRDIGAFTTAAVATGGDLVSRLVAPSWEAGTERQAAFDEALSTMNKNLKTNFMENLVNFRNPALPGAGFLAAVGITAASAAGDFITPIFEHHEDNAKDTLNSARNAFGDIRVGEYHPLRMNGGAADFRLLDPEKDGTITSDGFVINSDRISPQSTLQAGKLIDVDYTSFPLVRLDREGRILSVVQKSDPNSDWNMYGGSYTAATIVLTAAMLPLAGPEAMGATANALRSGNVVRIAATAPQGILGASVAAETAIGVPMLAGAVGEYINLTKEREALERSRQNAAPATTPPTAQPSPQRAPDAPLAAPAEAPRVFRISDEQRAPFDQAIINQALLFENQLDKETGGFNAESIEVLQENLIHAQRMDARHQTGEINAFTMRGIEAALKAQLNPATISAEQQSQLVSVIENTLHDLDKNQPDSSSMDPRILSFQMTAYLLGVYNGPITGIASSETMESIAFVKAELNAPEVNKAVPEQPQVQTASTNQAHPNMKPELTPAAM